MALPGRGVVIAYGMAIYLFASIFYLIFTRSIGTPFNDSLNEKQKIIKKKSSKLRGIIFVEGLFLGLVLSLIFKPFNKC